MADDLLSVIILILNEVKPFHLSLKCSYNSLIMSASNCLMLGY